MNVRGRNDEHFVLSGEGNIHCFGDIRVLLDYEDADNTIMADNCFSYLFYNNSLLISAPKLLSMSLSQGCYKGIFGLTSLTQAPELPAMELAVGCYNSMFQNCYLLVQAPKLPATTLADGCYGCMFINCTSLQNPPLLSSMELKNSCYWSMFNGCTSLISAPALPAENLADSCYSSMFYNCKELNEIPAISASSFDCQKPMWQMFYGCQKLKLSETQTDEYCNKYQIPNYGSSGSDCVANILYQTGGIFARTPSSGQTLWTSNEVIYP